MSTTNFEKHTTSNPLSKLFLNNFSHTVITELKNIAPTSILDVGAGEGFLLQRLVDNHIGKHHEGIEYVDEAIALAKKYHPKLTIKKGDIYKLPYKDNSFDLLICTEVLEHLEDPTKALKELLRVSKKYCLLTVPNEPYFTIQRFIRGKNIFRLGDHPEHIQHWTSGGFRNFVSQYAKIKIFRRPFPWTLLLIEK
jgi:ubiquinone/menaquinone biosynthesis C-methylase UbiE